MKKTLLISILFLLYGHFTFASDFESQFKKAQSGDNEAQLSVGDMYFQGKIIPLDYTKAFYWWMMAAEQENSDAQHKIAYMYENGLGTIQDQQKANFWGVKSAKNGNVDAQEDISEKYVFGGKGFIQNYEKAFFWAQKAAMQGHMRAQYNLGVLYGQGKGVPQNYKLAYVWSSLSVAQGYKNAKKLRSIAVNYLTPDQLLDAQEIAVNIQSKINKKSYSYKKEDLLPKTEKQMIGSGTGFFITQNGYILTCYHVVQGANKIEIIAGKNIYPAKFIQGDSSNDLAVLKVEGSFSPIAFSSKINAKMGEYVFTIGFPNPSLQGINLKFTEGSISSLTGFQDDLRFYQISVPVQPGNSGGPLLDKNGNIIGIIVSKLSAKETFRISGSLPQNVNYAIKSIYAKAMLSSLPQVSSKLIKPKIDNSDAVEKDKKSIVMILSYE